MNAKPELVPASARNPSAASTFAEPASHGFGMMNGAPSCSARNAVAFSCWVGPTFTSYAAATFLGTTIAHASSTSSRISGGSIAASRTSTQLYRRSPPVGSMNLSGSDSTSASRHSFGNAKPITVSSREKST